MTVIMTPMIRAAAVVVLILGFGTTVLAAEPAVAVSKIESPDGELIDPSVSMILFYSDACVHCHNQMRWLEEVREDFPDVTFHRYEIDVTQNEENQAYFAEVMAAYESVPRAWPRTVVGDRVYVGFVPDDGAPQFNNQYLGWLGYRNILYRALERAQERAVAAQS